MRAITVICAVLCASAVTSGCLRKDVSHTLYLSASGVVWSVLERDVRSDEDSPLKRSVEEQEYFLAASAGTHPVARALRALDATGVTTKLLRDERPYSVLTEARFAGPREVALALIREAGARGDAWLETAGCTTTLHVRIELESAGASDEDTLDALIADLADYRIAIADGRFTAAVGFTIEEDGVVTVPDPATEAEDVVLMLSLGWRSYACA